MDNKKIISTVISKTIVFVCVIAFVLLFSSVFGSENLFIGVTTISISLMLLQRDLTAQPIKNLLFIMTFNLILGLGALAVELNIWLGIIANFAIMFGIGYFFSFELRKPINMLVGLHYLLIMTTPVGISGFPKRVVALIASACILMGIQLLANKNKLSKVNEKMLSVIRKDILIKMDLMLKKEDTSSINEKIDEVINELKRIIYDGAKINFHLTMQGEVVLNILACLEKINSLLDTVDETVLTNDFLKEIKYQLEHIKDAEFSVQGIENQIHSLKRADLNIINAYKFVSYLQVLKTEVDKKEKLLKEEKDSIIKQFNMPKDFARLNDHYKDTALTANRVPYAIRVALLVTVTSFITNYFHLEYGNWMMYTVFALTQPYSEFAIKKSKKRIVGTCIGAMGALILLSLVKDPGVRTILVLLIGYVFSYVVDYRNVVIVLTMISITSTAKLMTDPTIVVMSRLIYVAIGIVIAVIANKFILNRTYDDEAEHIDKLQEKVTNKLLEEVVVKEEKHQPVIQNLYLIPSFISHRAQILDLDVDHEKLKRERQAINQLYCMYLLDSEQYKQIVEFIKELIQNNTHKLEKLQSEIKKAIIEVTNEREKHFLATLLEELSVGAIG